MRKFKSLFFLIIAAFVLFVAIGCGGSKIELSFDNETYTVEVGKEITVAPTVKNEENEEYTLKYSSIDETIATYIDGKVKGLKVGETEIKVSLEGNDKIFATAKVNVVEVTKYTVTFDTDGGTEIAAVQVVKGEKLTLPTAPTKAGYVFKGWFTNEARTVPFNPDVAINANTTLYAKWEVAQYTVTFDSNGGSAVSPVGVNHGGKVQKPTNPTKENHDFVGWFTAEDEEFDFLNTTITSDLTLYAKWELKTFEVVFNSDGGSFVPGQSIKYGAKATKPADPTKDGYIFKGWFKDVNRTQPFDFDEEVITDITILYAKWEYDMTGKAQVEFVLDEGIYFPINQLDFFLAGIEPTGSHPIASYLGVYGNEIASKGIMIYHTVVSGYLWSTKLLVARNANGFYEVVAKAAAGTSLPSDLPDYEFVILGHDSNYAAYQFVNSISVGNIITFVNWDFSTTEGGLVPQGAMLKVYPAGSGDLTTPAILEEGAALPSPMKAEATFLGWYDNPEFTGEPVTGAVTGKLYAKWGAPVRTITYNLDGGVFGYADKAAMVADFMKDFNKMFNMNITADQFQAKTYQKNVFTIFSDPTYGPKWVWMREYLIKVAEETGHGSAVELKNNNDGFWRSTIDSFLNDRVRVDWPSTVDYSNPELAEGFWYVFKPVESFTRESDTFTLLTPKKEYHIFVGWYTNPEFTGSPVTQVEKGTDQDLVLYAKFEPIMVDVTFMDGEELVQVVAVPMNTKVAALAALSKQGYLFTGWYADAAATTLFDFDTLILEPVTIYAGWTEALDSTVEYEAVYNEARGRWYIKVIGPIDLDINTIKAIYLITEAGVNIDPVALTPDTDKVLWFSVALEDGDLTFKKAGIYTYKAVKLDDTEVIFGYDYDPELVTGIKHKVEFDTNGGSLIDVVIVDMKTKVTKPADPTKEGMIFAGWYVDPEFKTAYNFDTPVTKNLVLYAKWHYPPFPITYHLDGGEFLPPVFDSKQEMVEAFLTDFYNFMNPTEVTLEEWMHKAEEPGKYTGKWLDNFASLYEKNNRSVDENSTKFINQPLYNAKWLPFFDMMEEFTKGVNSAQSFWNDTYVASLRMPVYMRGEKPWSYVPDSVYNLFPEAYVLVKEYKHEGPEFELPTNIVKEGYVFAGWYDNPEFTGDRYYVIPVGTFGPIHLYAKWVEEGQVDLSEIVVAAGYEDGETITYLGRTFVMGQNAFATLQDALAVAPNNAKIYVLEGTYADAATVTQNGLTIIGNNAVITGTINVASGVNGLTIKGFTFTNKGQVLIDVKGGVSNFTFEGNHVYDTTTVVISFKNDGTDVNTNFVIKNNVFEVVNLTAFDGRYIRGGNITNLTITGNKFVGLRANYVDAIRIEGKNESNSEGTGAAGVVLIEGNEFINIGQRAIWFRVYSATSITIQDNLFDWAGDQSYGGAIQLETWKAGQTTEITIKQNTFKNIMASFYVRLNNSGMAANATWKVDINYNEFFAPITTATSLYVDAYSEAAANLINAENNIFHEEPVPSRFKFVGKYSELVSEDDVFYTVEFNTDGGSEISPVVVKEGRKVQKPADPTKPGFEFVGWFADDERTIPFDFSTPITKDTVIFAKWVEEAKYTITYNLNGGDFLVFETREEMLEAFLTDFYNYLSSRGIIKGEDLVTFMHGAGKTSGFDGTYNDSAYFAELYVQGNKTMNPSLNKFIHMPEYHAKWMPLMELINSYVNINVDQTLWGSTWVGSLRFKPFFVKGNPWGAWAQAQVDVITNKIPVEYTMEVVVTEFKASTPDFDLPILLVKDNAKFLGWYTTPDFTGEPITKVVKGTNQNLDLYAKWEEILPTIADVRAANVNDLVVTKGIVTLKIGNNAYIQDATGGIYVYVGTGSGSAELGSKLVVGNEVKVVGKRAVFNQAAQIGTIQSIEVLNTNQTVPAAVEVTDLSKLLEYEGQLVTIKDVTITYIPNISTGGYSVKVAKEEVEFEVRVDAAALEFAGIKSLFQSSVAGLKVDLINVVASRYNTTPQVMVSLEDSVVVKEPTNAEFENILNPGEEVTEDLDLLTALNILGKAYTITWSSNNTDVISNTGVVNRPAMGSEDALVKLTAVLKLDGQTVATFEFEVTVLAKTEGELSKLETVTFEEDFTTSTTYNNTTQLLIGPEGKQWGVVHGTPSTTDPINGSISMQMRIYNNTNVSVYARTLYTVENVKEITFFALTNSAANVKVQVSVSTDGETWTNAQTYSLTTTGTEYKYTLAEASTVYVKFTLVVENKPSSGSWRLTIDDVTFWG